MTRVKTVAPRVSRADVRRAQPPAKRANPFYLTPEWRELVAQLIRERGRRCEQCGRAGCRVFGDHISELADGGSPFEPANIKLLCGACHTKKTAAARARRTARLEEGGRVGSLGPGRGNRAGSHSEILQGQESRVKKAADRAFEGGGGKIFDEKAGISERRRRFVEAYLADPNGTKAAIAAGYSPRTAASQASRLLRNVEIQAAIAAALTKLDATPVAGASAPAVESTPSQAARAAAVLAEMERIACADIRKLVRWRSIATANVAIDDGELEIAHATDVELVASDDIPDDIAAAIAEVSKSSTGTLKVKLHPKAPMLIALARIYGLVGRQNEKSKPAPEATPQPTAPADEWDTIVGPAGSRLN